MKNTAQMKFDAEMQKLNTEFTRKRNAISKEREAMRMEYCKRINDRRDKFIKYKREMVEHITDLRMEKAQYYDGDPDKEVCGAKIKAVEDNLSLEKAQVEYDINKLRLKQKEKEAELNDMSRRLTEEHECEKQQAYARYLAEVEADAESERVRQANESLAKGGAE